MRQLQLFTTAELAAMRDRTASRNHSPGRDQFRREHARHRAWGLTRRHTERLRRIRDASRDSPAGNPTRHRREQPAPPRRSQQTSPRPAARPQPAPRPAPSAKPSNQPEPLTMSPDADRSGGIRHDRQPPSAQLEPTTVGDHPEPPQRPVPAARRCPPTASRRLRRRPNPTGMPAPIKLGPHSWPQSPQRNCCVVGISQGATTGSRPEISQSRPRTRAPPTPNSFSSGLDQNTFRRPQPALTSAEPDALRWSSRPAAYSSMAPPMRRRCLRNVYDLSAARVVR
jgi:hypothetical protein